MSKDLAKLVVSLEAESARLQKDLDKANRKLDGFAKGADRTAARFKKSFVALGAAIPVAALAAATKYSLDYADGIADAAEQTAFSTTKLQELRFAADQTGISVSMLEGGLGRFTKRLGLARRGTGAAAKAYKDLGIDLSRTNDQVFSEVVDILGDMENQTDRLALSTRFFGDDAQRLGVLFQNGNRGLKEYADRAHELGLVLSDDLVQGASDANDQLAIMKQVINVQFTRVFVELAPIITEVGQAFADAAPKVAAFFGSFGEVEDQSARALEQTIKNIRSQVADLQALRTRIRTDSPNTTESFLGFPLTEDEVNQRIDDYFSKWVKATERLKALRQKAEGDANNSLTGTGTGSSSNTGQSEEEEKRLKQLQKLYDDSFISLQKTADLIGVTTEYERVLWETQKGRYKDLNANQKQSLLDQAKRADQLREAATAEQEAARAKELAEEKAQRLNEQLDTEADRWRELINPMQSVSEEMARLDLLYETGRISLDTYGEAMFRVLEGVEEQAKEVENQWEGLGFTFASAFEDAIVESNNLSDVLKGLEKDLKRIVTRRLVTEPLGNYVSGLVGDVFSFDGGGYTGSGWRMGGVDGKGGYPAILHPNETVIDHTKGQRSGGMVVNVNVSGVRDEGSLKRTAAQIAQQSGAAAQRAMARNG